MRNTVLSLPIFLGLSIVQAAAAPVVDLGYEQYQGFYNSNYDLNVFNGIRYAAPPVGKLRWQMPQSPAQNRQAILSAVDYAPRCPQTPNNLGELPGSPLISEDCLFLNVIAPAGKSNLPVFVWIHGGGYGLGDNQVDWQPAIHTNNNAYISVSIQYRLGAFGFLSTPDVKKSGVLNAGLHDMRFALQWVQQNIHLFGGDPDRVTIAGESAGGGAVMLLAMANGGTEGDALFQGLIVASPYLPTQWNYDDSWPALTAHNFIEAAGCSNAAAVFTCLQAADTDTLQEASAAAGEPGIYGQWVFLPVTDGTLIRKRPSQQLHVDKTVNGLRMLSGNNANEGGLFTPQNITTQAGFVTFVKTNYPRLSDSNITSILNLYSVPDNVQKIYADSDGLHAPFSTTNSNWAVGWQQAANNLYAEATFVCPAYWLADAYAGVSGKQAWKYQFSPPISGHAADILPIMVDPGVTGTGLDRVFRTAFQHTWGNFIVGGNPTLTTAQINSATQGNITAASSTNWKPWGGQSTNDYLLNLNMTGGKPVITPYQVGSKVFDLTSYVSDSAYPKLQASFNVVPGYTWEAGRGTRCQLWVDLGKWTME